MGAWLHSETLWLDLTNVALGVVTLVCLAVIAAGVVQEVLGRLRSRAAQDDAHVLVSPELGITMADGGRRIDRPRKRRLWRRGSR
jgi:hypothetical protein